jgi:hypothetical protein
MLAKSVPREDKDSNTMYSFGMPRPCRMTQSTMKLNTPATSIKCIPAKSSQDVRPSTIDPRTPMSERNYNAKRARAETRGLSSSASTRPAVTVRVHNVVRVVLTAKVVILLGTNAFGEHGTCDHSWSVLGNVGFLVIAVGVGVD